MKIREIVSTIENELNNISLDDRKSKRFIFSKVLYYSELFIKRESDSRRIFNSSNLFTFENCFEMKETSLMNCTDVYIPNVETVSKSKKPLPEFYSSIYGNLLTVMTLDGSRRYEMTTPDNYKNIVNREFLPKNGYYWIDNNYLVIPSYIEAVKLSYLKKVSLQNSSLDGDITIPEWLLADIVKNVVADIRNTKSIPSDENPDMNINNK